MLQNIARRLGELGCEVKSDDSELLVYCKNKVENYIKTFCNLTEIPDELLEIFYDRVCGEFLFSKYCKGKIAAGNFENSEKNIKTISEGDVSVTFSDEDNLDYLDKLIEKLLNSGRGEILCYRKIRW